MTKEFEIGITKKYLDFIEEKALIKKLISKLFKHILASVKNKL